MNATAASPTSRRRLEGRWETIGVFLLVFGAFALYALNVDYTLYGDAGMYSDYVTLRKFDELTLHLGYYVALFLATSLGGIFSIPIQECAGWLNVIAGALSVGVAYQFARELLGVRRDALLCAAIFGLSGRVLANATSSEIYMLQTLFVLLSFYLFTRDRIVFSGLAAAAGLLVSPLSIFAYLFYPVYDYLRSGSIRWRLLLRLTLAASTIYLPFFIVDGHEVLWGVRGLLVIKGITPFDPHTMLANFPVYQFKAFTVLSLLLIPALLKWRENRHVFIISLAVAIPHIYLICKLPTEDHVFILNTDFFFACCLVLGWREMRKFRIGRWIPPILLAAHIGIFLASGLIHSFDPHREYADELRRVVRTYLNGRDSVMVTDWGRAVALTFYGRSRPVTTVRNEHLFQKQLFDIELPDPISKLSGREIFLLDGWAPSPLNRFFRSKSSLDAFRNEHSIVFVAERKLGLQCALLEDTAYFRIYQCTR